jgi:two-component system sensor histidine kinase SenX3
VPFLVGLLIGLGAGAVVAVLTVRHRTVRRLETVATHLEPERGRLPTAGVTTALERLKKSVAREQEAGRELAAGVERLRVALDALPIGVVVIDGAGAIVLRNHAAVRFLGIRHADVLVDEAVGAHLRAALKGEHRRQVLDLYGPPRRTVVVTAIPLDGENGARAALATIEDVSDRAHLDAVRTDFVANISHELKTPVGALALLAETIMGEDEPAIVTRLAEKMVLEAHRVARIIEDLLELARIELGEAPHRDAVSLGLVASEAVDRVRALADYRGSRVDVHEPSRRLVVVGDRRQLVSAVVNLLENGLKYSDPGSVVEFAARVDGAWVDVEVTDHGIGIPARDLDRIFERFYRVDRARSRETGGTGLGLAIVRHVATNHGGHVSVRSQEGVGSTFVLRIPGGTQPAPEPLPVAEQAR